MSQSILDVLQEDTSNESQWLSKLGTALQEKRAWIGESLATAEFEEGLYLNDDEAWEMAQLETMELAAEDKKALTFPTHYHGGPWRIVLKRQADGTPVVRIDQGMENAEILINDAWIHVAKDQEVPVPDLQEPPLQLHIRILGEGSWLIWPR